MLRASCVGGKESYSIQQLHPRILKGVGTNVLLLHAPLDLHTCFTFAFICITGKTPILMDMEWTHGHSAGRLRCCAMQNGIVQCTYVCRVDSRCFCRDMGSEINDCLAMVHTSDHHRSVWNNFTLQLQVDKEKFDDNLIIHE